MLHLVARRVSTICGKVFQPGDEIDVNLTERELAKYLKLGRVGIRNVVEAPAPPVQVVETPSAPKPRVRKGAKAF